MRERLQMGTVNWRFVILLLVIVVSVMLYEIIVV